MMEPEPLITPPKEVCAEPVTVRTYPEVFTLPPKVRSPVPALDHVWFAPSEIRGEIETREEPEVTARPPLPMVSW